MRIWFASIVCALLGCTAVIAAEPVIPAQTQKNREQLPAKEGDWENLPDGSTGKTTTFTGKDGTIIGAYLRKPMGDGPFPLIVVLHGGSNSLQGTYQVGRLMDPPVADFVKAGWAIYAIDYRPRSALTEIECDDTAQAIAKARLLPFIDGKHVALFGGSHGGHTVCRMASRCDVSCVVSCAPAGIDLLEVAKLIKAGTKVAKDLRGLVESMERKSGAAVEAIAQDPAKFHYNSPLTEASAVRCPILLVSARNDGASPIPVLDIYVKRLRDAGKEVETYYPDDGRHGFYFGRPKVTPETTECARLAVAFIARHFAK